MKLSETRSYGTVYGHTKIAYEQDGHYFGPDKQRLTEPVPDDPVPPALTEEQQAERSRKIKEGLARRKAAQSQVNS